MTWSTAQTRSRCMQTQLPRASGSCWWTTSSPLAVPLQQVMLRLPAAAALASPCAEREAHCMHTFGGVECPELRVLKLPDDAARQESSSWTS
jgi:hypothetical protein